MPATALDLWLAKKSARVAATVFQEEAFISGLLSENSWKDPVKIPMKMEVQSEPKINKKWAKNRPQEGYPIGSGAPWRALGRSWAALEHGTLITTIFVLFSCGSWAHLGGVLGPKLGVLGAKTTQFFLPRRPMMPLRCLQDSPRSDFHKKKRRKIEPFELGQMYFWSAGPRGSFFSAHFPPFWGLFYSILDAIL